MLDPMVMNILHRALSIQDNKFDPPVPIALFAGTATRWHNSHTLLSTLLVCFPRAFATPRIVPLVAHGVCQASYLARTLPNSSWAPGAGIAGHGLCSRCAHPPCRADCSECPLSCYHRPLKLSFAALRG